MFYTNEKGFQQLLRDAIKYRMLCRLSERKPEANLPPGSVDLLDLILEEAR